MPTVMGLTVAGDSRSNRTQADGPSPDGEVEVGTSEYQKIEVENFDRMWWLPAGGFGNGLDDASWVAVVDVCDEQVAHDVLDKMFAAGVPAYAAPLPRLETVRSHSRRVGGVLAPVRIWAGATTYGKARDVLLGLLPRLVDEHGEDVIR